MKKLFSLLIMSIVLFTVFGCAENKLPTEDNITYIPSESSSLGKVKNIQVKGQILSFDSVENAVSYELEIYKDNKLVVQEIIGKNFLDLSPYHLIGTYTLKIKAAKGLNYGELTTAEIVVMEKVNDVRLEAEDGLMDYSLYKGNKLSSGNAYVGDIDDCGMGLYYNYFCHVAGEYDLEAYYLTESIGSKHDVFVNGSYADSFVYNTNTGWGTAEHFETACTKIKINLIQGWNTICVMKNGSEAENYGGWAELDYLVLKGQDLYYNQEDFALINTKVSSTYRLEAELACPLSRTIIDGLYKWDVYKGNVPMPVSQASNGYLRGNLDETGQGMEWQFNCRRAGKYQVTVVFAHEYDANESAIVFYHHYQTLRGVKVQADELENYNQNIVNLDQGLGWDKPVVNSETFVLELQEGENFIYAIREESADKGYFQIDYIELNYMEED